MGALKQVKYLSFRRMVKWGKDINPDDPSPMEALGDAIAEMVSLRHLNASDNDKFSTPVPENFAEAVWHIGSIKIGSTYKLITGTRRFDFSTHVETPIGPTDAMVLSQDKTFMKMYSAKIADSNMDFKEMKTARALDLKEQNLTVQDAVIVTSFVGRNEFLTRLDLSKNRLCGIEYGGAGKFDPTAIRVLAMYLAEGRLPLLTELDLSRNFICGIHQGGGTYDDTAIKELCKAIQGDRCQLSSLE